MIRTDTLAGPEINQGRPFGERSGPEDGYNGFRMVERRNGYGTKPVRGEGEYLREFLIFSEPLLRRHRRENER